MAAGFSRGRFVSRWEEPSTRSKTPRHRSLRRRGARKANHRVEFRGILIRRLLDRLESRLKGRDFEAVFLLPTFVFLDASGERRIRFLEVRSLRGRVRQRLVVPILVADESPRAEEPNAGAKPNDDRDPTKGNAKGFIVRCHRGFCRFQKSPGRPFLARLLAKVKNRYPLPEQAPIRAKAPRGRGAFLAPVQKREEIADFARPEHEADPDCDRGGRPAAKPAETIKPSAIAIGEEVPRHQAGDPLRPAKAVEFLRHLRVNERPCPRKHDVERQRVRTVLGLILRP